MRNNFSSYFFRQRKKRKWDSRFCWITGGKDYVIFRGPAHRFVSMKEEMTSVLFDEKRKSTMHNSTDESQARRVSAKSAGIANFPNKTLVFTSVLGGDRKNVDGCTRVARVLSSFRPSLLSWFPLLRRIKKKDCWFVSSIILSRKKKCSSREKKKEERIWKRNRRAELSEESSKKEEEEINDDSRSTTSFFNFQNNFETTTIHPLPTTANTTPTKTHRTIAPKEPFTSLYVEA